MFDTRAPTQTQRRVQVVLMPGAGACSVTVVDPNFEPVEPIESYLAHFVALERSPNTVRAYAMSLELFFQFLATRDVAWKAVDLDDVSRFLSWMPSPAEGVVLLHVTAARRSETTINRHGNRFRPERWLICSGSVG